MTDDGRDATAGAGERGRGETWRTYRYRLGAGSAEASGTIKAPSFASAARRLVDRRLAGALGPTPAYLRLRAAGEEEVWFRVTPPAAGSAGAPRLEVVPPDAHRFGPADTAAAPDPGSGGDPAG